MKEEKGLDIFVISLAPNIRYPSSGRLCLLAVPTPDQNLHPSNSWPTANPQHGDVVLIGTGKTSTLQFYSHPYSIFVQPHPLHPRHPIVSQGLVETFCAYNT